jgi:hypothetical protein
MDVALINMHFFQKFTRISSIDLISDQHCFGRQTICRHVVGTNQ